MRAERSARPRRRRFRWALMTLCLAVVLIAMLFAGVATHTIGLSSEPHPTGPQWAPLAHAQPLLAERHGRLVSIERSPGRRIALTFDDGPDPHWTPRIANVLARHRVPATFFVVGSQAASHPEVVRMLVRQGFELGNHTFTHVQLTATPAFHARLQLDLTEAVLAGITGRYARFMRPPYSGTPDTVTAPQMRALAKIAGRRYIVALANYDSKDWKRPGVGEIVTNATPKGRRGGVIMFHDGGGRRAQTVAALAKLIPRLRERGFRFVSLTELSGIPYDVAYPRATSGERRRAALFVWGIRSALFVTALITALLIGVGILVGVRVLMAAGLAAYHAWTTRSQAVLGPYRPSVSIVVPAYNEELVIERTLRSLAASDYPTLEIVVVDDGSTDGTAAAVERLTSDRIRLLRQRNAGKAAALNTGIRASSGEVVVMVDADTLFESETLSRLVQPLADPNVGAVSGNTKVGNRRTLIGRLQHIEYVVGFNLDRRMYDVLGCMPTVPGAVGAYRRDALEAVGGVSGATLAEDTDLTLAIGRRGLRVGYVARARAWTEAPSTLRGLWRQRYRWSFGTIQAVWKHNRAIVSRDRRERRIGRRVLPYLITFQILLPLAAPLVDLVTLYGAIFTDATAVLGFWIAFNAMQLCLAVFAFRLDGESVRSLWALPLQQFVYRQLMYLVIVESAINALVGTSAGWLHVQRTGDVEVETVG